ncbi:DUF6434 domain-containing protein [Bacillus sp. 31A1R]|uniref:DUF6434 domain-containing protein n=1 Tax=Robertmurraya mangrovi TaxID=3098077 RepID=A0ABU5ISQ9_9BACI|nr:DUF6434 domain-containing protein [Bacillus sp. 31A1R]MDZ5470189.1 DUF6434 domain-containing protein [Bacillus sp. 31A1R]
MRPKLSKEMNPQDFISFYWLKSELQNFCKQEGIPTSGSKLELTNRITTYLETGLISSSKLKMKRTKDKVHSQEELSLNTVITEQHRCSQSVRHFFKTVIGEHFHFSTYIQNYFKDNVGKTYRDAVSAWDEEEVRKKNPDYQTNISPQFEYNQFIRDYFTDPSNDGKSLQEAISAWKHIKKLPGSNKYVPQ